MTIISNCSYDLHSDTTVLTIKNDNIPVATVTIDFPEEHVSNARIEILNEQEFIKIPVTCTPHLLALVIATIEEVRATNVEAEIYADLEYPIPVRF